MNMTLRYRNYIYSSRRLNLKTLINKGLGVGEKVAKNNVIDLMKMIIWNKEHGISVMRVSSELVPHGTNVKLVEKYGKKAEDYIDLKFLKPHLKMVGELARLEGMRITFHPAQFVQLGSPDERVFKNSVKELEMHANFLDLMGMGEDSVIVVHIGGTYCKKKETIDRYIKKVNNLPKFIKDRLVFENDEKCYDAEDVLDICKKVNRPMVFDYHHYECYPNYNKDLDLNKRMTVKELIPKVLKTWTKLGIRPKVHLSEQMPNKPVGTHSLFIERIP
jgi:UV DNA damage endonuclease